MIVKIKYFLLLFYICFLILTKNHFLLIFKYEKIFKVVIFQIIFKYLIVYSHLNKFIHLIKNIIHIFQVLFNWMQILEWIYQIINMIIIFTNFKIIMWIIKYFS